MTVSNDHDTLLHGAVFWWQVVAACCAAVGAATIIAFLLYISGRLAFQDRQIALRDIQLEALQKLDQGQSDVLKQIQQENDRLIKAIEAMRKDQVELLQYGYFHKRNKQQ